MSTAQQNTIAEHYGRWCGKWTVKGRAFDKGSTIYNRVHCKCWDCPHCGPRKAGRYKHAIIAAAEQFTLTRFLTLTLDPKRVSKADALPYLRRTFDKFRTYLRRKFGCSPKYIAVLEFHESGYPHLHLLIDRFIDWQWIRDAWQAVGGGSHVHIKRVDIHRVAPYLSKYLTKALATRRDSGKREIAGRRVPAIRSRERFRRVTVARGIKLNRKPKQAHKWAMLRQSIAWILYRKGRIAENITRDEFDQVSSFTVRADVSRAWSGSVASDHHNQATRRRSA